MSKLHSNRVELGSLTTSQRDALSSIPAGTVIYNSSNNNVEHWDGSAWISMSNVFSASGGSKNTSSRSGYAVHTFTSPGTFTVSGGSGTIETLIIGGGGGGGSGNNQGYESGGGGASAAYYNNNMTVGAGSYPVSVGGGGNGANGSGAGSTGSNSSFNGKTGTGGGGGGSGGASGNPGGCGGGGAHASTGSGSGSGATGG